MECNFISISPEPVSLDKLYSLIWDCSNDIGAVAAYVGRVKGENLVFEIRVVDESGLRLELEEAVNEAFRRWGGLRGVVLHVRFGELKPGDPIVYIVVAGSSRRDVLEALAWLVERYKSLAFIEKSERVAHG